MATVYISLKCFIINKGRHNNDMGEGTTKAHLPKDLILIVTNFLDFMSQSGSMHPKSILSYKILNYTINLSHQILNSQLLTHKKNIIIKGTYMNSSTYTF